MIWLFREEAVPVDAHDFNDDRLERLFINLFRRALLTLLDNDPIQDE